MRNMEFKKFRNRIKKIDNELISWDDICLAYGKKLAYPNNEQLLSIIQYIKENNGSKNILIYYESFSDDLDYFSVDNFKEYMNFLKVNKINFCPAKLEHQIKKYGVELGTKKYKEYIKIYNNRNYYQLDHYLKKGKTVEEAELLIKDLKSRTSGNKQNFIKRYGKELGEIKFNEFRNKSAHSKEKFIEKYGEIEGNNKWIIYRSKKDSVSKEFHKRKYGDKWEQKYKERIKNTIVTPQKYIIKYGEELGKIKYSELIKSRIKKIVGASKKSIEFFSPILYKLSYMNIKYYVGTDRREYHVYCAETNKNYFYDLVIPELRLVLEYNGIHIHPNPKTFTEEQKIKWRCPFRKIGYQEALDFDNFKSNLIKKLRNFDVYHIFSDEISTIEGLDKKYIEIYNLIEERNNENKKDSRKRN